jgi:hypothetical protein
MKTNVLKKGLFIFSMVAGGLLSVSAVADDDNSIARGERMGGERRPGGYGEGRYGGEDHPEQNHPAESEAARQDINRNQDMKNLQNNTNPGGYPAYTPYPGGTQGGGGTININSAPQSPQR